MKYDILDWASASLIRAYRRAGDAVPVASGSLQMIGWSIIRNGRVHGRALPTFIHNGHYFLEEIKVYANEAIDVWGDIDLDRFRRGELPGPSISTQPPAGSQVSTHNLGIGKIVEAKWHTSWEDVIAHVEQTLRELNPPILELVDLTGEAIESKDGVRVAKLGLASDWPCRVLANGQAVRGNEVPVFIREGSEFRLTRWFVYADNQCQIGSAAEAVPFEHVVRMIEGGIISTSVPDGVWVTIDGLGRCRFTGGRWWVKASERIRECRDLIEMARGGPGSVTSCRTCHAEYQKNPTNEQRELLRLTYEAVPEHLRMYCGDMDSKDWPIRRILYGT